MSVRVSSILAVPPLSSPDMGEEAVASKVGQCCWMGLALRQGPALVAVPGAGELQRCCPGWAGYHSQDSKQRSPKGTPKTGYPFVIASISLSISISFMLLLLFHFSLFGNCGPLIVVGGRLAA